MAEEVGVEEKIYPKEASSHTRGAIEKIEKEIENFMGESKRNKGEKNRLILFTLVSPGPLFIRSKIINGKFREKNKQGVLEGTITNLGVKIPEWLKLGKCGRGAPGEYKEYQFFGTKFKDFKLRIKVARAFKIPFISKYWLVYRPKRAEKPTA